MRPLQLAAEHPVPVQLRRQGLLQLLEATGAEDETEVSDGALSACAVIVRG